MDKDMMTFITIDLEGDANVQQCKEFFKEGNHFDKDTIPWCISFYNGEDLNTIVEKNSLQRTGIQSGLSKFLYVFNSHRKSIFTVTG